MAMEGYEAAAEQEQQAKEAKLTDEQRENLAVDQEKSEEIATTLEGFRNEEKELAHDVEENAPNINEVEGVTQKITGAKQSLDELIKSDTEVVTGISDALQKTEIGTAAEKALAGLDAASLQYVAENNMGIEQDYIPGFMNLRNLDNTPMRANLLRTYAIQPDIELGQLLAMYDVLHESLGDEADDILLQVVDQNITYALMQMDDKNEEVDVRWDLGTMPRTTTNEFKQKMFDHIKSNPELVIDRIIAERLPVNQFFKNFDKISSDENKQKMINWMMEDDHIILREEKAKLSEPDEGFTREQKEEKTAEELEKERAIANQGKMKNKAIKLVKGMADAKSKGELPAGAEQLVIKNLVDSGKLNLLASEDPFTFIDNKDSLQGAPGYEALLSTATSEETIRKANSKGINSAFWKNLDFLGNSFDVRKLIEEYSKEKDRSFDVVSNYKAYKDILPNHEEIFMNAVANYPTIFLSKGFYEGNENYRHLLDKTREQLKDQYDRGEVMETGAELLAQSPHIPKILDVIHTRGIRIRVGKRELDITDQSYQFISGLSKVADKLERRRNETDERFMQRAVNKYQKNLNDFLKTYKKKESPQRRKNTTVMYLYAQPEEDPNGAFRKNNMGERMLTYYKHNFGTVKNYSSNTDLAKKPDEFVSDIKGEIINKVLLAKKPGDVFVDLAVHGHPDATADFSKGNFEAKHFHDMVNIVSAIRKEYPDELAQFERKHGSLSSRVTFNIDSCYSGFKLPEEGQQDVANVQMSSSKQQAISLLTDRFLEAVETDKDGNRPGDFDGDGHVTYAEAKLYTMNAYKGSLMPTTFEDKRGFARDVASIGGPRSGSQGGTEIPETGIPAAPQVGPDTGYIDEQDPFANVG